MFRIYKNGSTIGYVENPTYIRLQKNGVYGLCDDPEFAHGIVYDGTVYHLLGRDELPDAESVILVQTDVGERLANNINSIELLESMMVEHEYALTLMEYGVTE